MKRKIFFTLIALLGLCHLETAQSQINRYTKVNKMARFGISVIGHNSHITGIHSISKGRYGFSFAFFTQINLSPNSITTANRLRTTELFFAPQLEYNMLGERSQSRDKNDPEINKHYNDYIQLALPIKYYFKFNRFAKHQNFIIKGGPFLGYAIVNNTKGDHFFEPIKIQEAHENLKNFDVGFNLAIGYRFIPELEGFIRGSYGLMEVYKGQIAENGQKTHNYTLGAGLSWIIN